MVGETRLRAQGQGKNNDMRWTESQVWRGEPVGWRARWCYLRPEAGVEAKGGLGSIVSTRWAAGAGRC